MIGRHVKLNDIVLNKYGFVESVEYPEFSFEKIYKERALKPSEFDKHIRTHKAVTVYFRIIKETIKDSRNALDTVKSYLTYLEPMSFVLDEKKHCQVVIDSIESEEVDNAILATLNLINLDGVWYSEIKKISVANGKLELKTNTIIDSDKFKITAKPNTNFISIKDSIGNVIEPFINNNLNSITIDFEKKLVTQSGRFIPVKLNSNFFKLRKENLILFESLSNIVVEYREVVDL